LFRNLASLPIEARKQLKIEEKKHLDALSTPEAQRYLLRQMPVNEQGVILILLR
jgi:hypothetical protein